MKFYEFVSSAFRVGTAFGVTAKCSGNLSILGCSGLSQHRYNGLEPGGPSKDFTIPTSAGGEERNYLLHLPADYNGFNPSPLILVFHGKLQDASEIEGQTQFSNPSFNPHAIVVYPQGVKEQWTGDPESPPRSKIDDIEFIHDLLDYLERHYCIGNIYATGFSNGGGLTALLACSNKLSGLFTAFAASSGAFYRDSALVEPLFGRCEPSQPPIPILEFHGSKDPVIHYDGKTTPDGETYSLPEWLQEWAIRNGCTAEEAEKGNVTTMLYDGKVEKTTWTCDGREDVVVHYYIYGFGHGWPTTYPLDNDDQRHGPTYFNATPIVMDFFNSWPGPNRTVYDDTKDEL